MWDIKSFHIFHIFFSSFLWRCFRISSFRNFVLLSFVSGFFIMIIIIIIITIVIIFIIVVIIIIIIIITDKKKYIDKKNHYIILLLNWYAANLVNFIIHIFKD